MNSRGEIMLLSSSSSATFPRHLSQTFFSHSKAHKLNNRFPFKKPTAQVICLSIGLEEVAEIVHNKPLVAAAFSAAIGQFSKPFTSALYGNGVDFRAIIRSGGMPSTHSAGVVAAATCLGLERGFSDSIFGMTVVFAGIVMYDAQGVRKEVGYHAKILNTILLRTQENPTPSGEKDDLIDSKLGSSSINSESLSPLLSVSETVSSYTENPTAPSFCRLPKLTSRPNGMPSNSVGDIEDELKKEYRKYYPLKESVGHTELEVIVGGLLGFLVSLAVEIIL
ncbi:acid phosphatase/vanadium-dependent haloperoxidase-related protein [Tasmannia lanceolata]|uniref:acid phosphatase/vanadium-dependent haloperoxidase-related protein n=1 Tax=Tasmannia lanceolata TaxID=3420 RepID=UPI0040646A6A